MSIHHLLFKLHLNHLNQVNLFPPLSLILFICVIIFFKLNIIILIQNMFELLFNFNILNEIILRFQHFYINKLDNLLIYLKFIHK